MLKVSAQRIVSALFVCLVVCEDYAAAVEYERDKAAPNGIERMWDDGTEGSDRTESNYPGGVLFHCAQGKDRTGILAMLLTFALYGDSVAVEERAVREYAASESLLLEKGINDYKNDDGKSNSRSDDDKIRLSRSLQLAEQKAEIKNDLNKGQNLADIKSLKGSPPEALRDTLARLRESYGGSILGYLDDIGFTSNYRKRLRLTAKKVDVNR
jgi:hypothetical protein